MVDVEPGADPAAVVAGIGGVDGADFVVDRTEHATVTGDAVRPIAIAVAAFALVIGLVGVAAAGVLVGRFALDATGDPPASSVRSAGRASRLSGQRWWSPGAIGAAAAVVAVVVATMASGSFPVGPARLAEPDPGLRLDPAVLALGAAVITVLVPLAVLPAAILTARRSASGRPARPVPAGPALASPAAVTGLAFAFGGGGRSQVTPARSALAGSILAVGSVVAAVVFAASLTDLTDTPARWGQTWAVLADGQFGPAPHGGCRRRLRRRPAGDRHRGGLLRPPLGRWC